MNNNPIFRRRNYFIKKNFQVNFTVKFLIIILIEAFLAAGLFLYMSKGPLTTGYLGSELRIARTYDFFLPMLLLSNLIIVGVSAVIGIGVLIFLSHRLAGPLYRFENILDAIKKGDLTQRFKLRENDQFEELTKTYGTQYSTIYYSDDKYFYDFTRKIGSGLQLFSEGQEKNPALAKNRVDRIVEQVQKILEMYPPEFHFKIYIYPSYKELKLIYMGIGNLGKSPIAFYNHKAKAVYVSLVDITDGVLAHEIAHAVINSSFAVPPPARMQEILAQYVDRHLWG